MTEPSLPLADQVQTTDIALRAWRDESVRRRAAYDAQQQELAAANRAWWNRNLRRTAFAFGTGAVMGLAIAVVGIDRTPDTGATEAASVAAPPIAASAPAATEVIAAPVAVVEPVVDEPVAVAETTSALMGETSLAVVPGSASTWRDDGYHWVQFQVQEAELVRIAWRDGAGAPVLEPMHCGSPVDGVRSCLAGRSHDRIAHAIDQGAAAGQWGVEACVSGGCVPVTTFTAP
jgi:hypothetical protein